MPAIKQYIEEKLRGVTEEDVSDRTFMEDDSAILLVSREPAEQPSELMEIDEYQDEEDAEEDEDIEEFKSEFLKALQEYGEKIVGGNMDKATLKAMKKMTKTLKRSKKCTPHTLQQQMHGFGAQGAASHRTKTGKIIKPNPPAIAARKAPGSMPAPLGRRPKDRSGGLGTLVGTKRTKRPHSLSLAVDNNVPGAK